MRQKMPWPQQAPYLIEPGFKDYEICALSDSYHAAEPFKYVVADNFLPKRHVKFLSDNFPSRSHPVWLDWKKRSPHQYGKQGPGCSRNFHLLDPHFRLALQEFNAATFLSFLEELTGIKKLLPDPYFTGGGIHQILKGGILDVHTDFNKYERLGLYRALNVLIYLNGEWSPSFGGELELWDKSPKLGGKPVKSIPPVYNRMVVFRTDKKSFHGHPNEWVAPEKITRRSIALYYYTSEPIDDGVYDANTDFMGVVSKVLPVD